MLSSEKTKKIKIIIMYPTLDRLVFMNQNQTKVVVNGTLYFIIRLPTTFPPPPCALINQRKHASLEMKSMYFAHPGDSSSSSFSAFV